MDAQRWQQVGVVFQEAVKLSADRRTTYLEETCAEDPELRGDVERMLDSLEEAGEFLEKPAAGLPDPYESLEIPPYRLIRRIGEGGMGVVYLAKRADDAFKKRVAVKLLRPTEMSQELVSRFRAERQILAGLDHPSIAKLLDGGTTPQGLPYLVMEYVEGKPIDEYCDRHCLTTRERLELFRKVCSAVQLAHQNLVVHRDIKPDNILVTADGTPKLLDFGIAKLLNPELSCQRLQPTATAFRLMTPEYASPEQIRGEWITTASDVYSLGVLLYKLVSGHSPYPMKSGSAADLVKAICDEEPEKVSLAVERCLQVLGPDGKTISVTPKSVSMIRDGDPSKLRRRLAGDVDNIVSMALRKQPRRRYASVEQMAEDVRNHLEGRPILAREKTLLYRLSKFVGQNRWPVAAATALVLASLAFGAVMAWQREQIALERDRLELVTQFVVDLFEISDPYSVRSSTDGGSITAREILDAGAAKLSVGLDDQPELEATLRSTIGTIFRRLGLFDESRPMLEKALRIHRETFGAKHPKVATSLHDLAELLLEKGLYDDALPMLEEALEIRRQVLGHLHPEVASTLSLLGTLHLSTDRYPEARQCFQESLDIRRLDSEVPEPDLAESYSNLASVHLLEGEYQVAEPLFRESIGLYRRSPDTAHPDLATALNNLAILMSRRGQPFEAEQLLRESLAIRQEAFSTEHPYVAESLDHLGWLLFRTGNTREAEEFLRQALEIRRRVLDSKHAHLAASLSHLASLYAEQGEAQRAEPLAREAVAILRQAFSPRDWRVKNVESILGGCLADMGLVEEAEPLLRESYETLREVLGDDAMPSREALKRWDAFRG